MEAVNDGLHFASATAASAAAAAPEVSAAAAASSAFLASMAFANVFATTSGNRKDASP